MTLSSQLSEALRERVTVHAKKRSFLDKLTSAGKDIVWETSLSGDAAKPVVTFFLNGKRVGDISFDGPGRWTTDRALLHQMQQFDAASEGFVLSPQIIDAALAKYASNDTIAKTKDRVVREARKSR